MRNVFSRLVLVLAAAIALPCATHAAALGGAAPPLKVSKMVKGDAVPENMTENGKIHVVEFWATWCGPCIANIPHMTMLQEKFKSDVIFVGISNEPLSTVEPFVKKMGDQMNYRVAVDEGGLLTLRKYDMTYKVAGIPHAFIVDRKGNVVWRGHPADPAMETSLEKMILGTFEMGKQPAPPAPVPARSEQSIRDYAKARSLGQAYAALVAAGTPDLAASVKTQMLELAVIDAKLYASIAGEALTQGNRETDPEIQKASYGAARELIEEANRISGGTDATVLDTYGYILFSLGEQERGIEMMQKAVFATEDKNSKRMLEMRLEMLKRQAKPAESPAAPAADAPVDAKPAAEAEPVTLH